jgi:hypothetical protein
MLDPATFELFVAATNGATPSIDALGTEFNSIALCD